MEFFVQASTFAWPGIPMRDAISGLPRGERLAIKTQVKLATWSRRSDHCSKAGLQPWPICRRKLATPPPSYLTDLGTPKLAAPNVNEGEAESLEVLPAPRD